MRFQVYIDPSKMVYNDLSKMVYNDLSKMVYNDHYKPFQKDHYKPRTSLMVQAAPTTASSALVVFLEICKFNKYGIRKLISKFFCDCVSIFNKTEKSFSPMACAINDKSLRFMTI